ncbi:acyl-CoA thioesterase [Phycicoccus endophyticus]|nr:acyl-CoA thioesterase [Phycicoccus endophyticus]
MYLRLLRVLLAARRGAGLTLWDTAVTPFRVRLSDLDLQRHMNNGTYLTIADLGRVDLMVRSGFWEQMRRRGWYPVVASQSIRYRRSLRWRQRFEVHTRVLGTDGHSTYLEQVFPVGDTVCAEAMIRARFLERGGGSVSQAELEQLVGEFPEDRELPSWVGPWAGQGREGATSPTAPAAVERSER